MSLLFNHFNNYHSINFSFVYSMVLLDRLHNTFRRSRRDTLQENVQENFSRIDSLTSRRRNCKKSQCIIAKIASNDAPLMNRNIKIISYNYFQKYSSWWTTVLAQLSLTVIIYILDERSGHRDYFADIENIKSGSR